MQGNLFYPFIVDWVFCPLYSTLAFCVTIKALLTTLPSPRGADTFLLRKTFLFRGFFIKFIYFSWSSYPFIHRTSHHAIIDGKLLFPINYKVCQIFVKLRLWPTFRDLLKKWENRAILNLEIRDFASVLFAVRTLVGDLIDWR